MMTFSSKGIKKPFTLSDLQGHRKSDVRQSVISNKFLRHFESTKPADHIPCTDPESFSLEFRSLGRVRLLCAAQHELVN